MQESYDSAERLTEAHLVSMETETDSRDADAVRSAELEAMFDTFLPDATTSERAQISAFQAELHIQQRRLAKLLAEGIIDVLEHARAVNKEINWCFRKAVRVLGHKRFRLLFDMDVAETEGLIDEREALLSDITHVDEAMLSEIMPSVNELVMRYIPTEAEQKYIVRASKTIDPQKREGISEVFWAPRSRYAQLVRGISVAEIAYRQGDLDKCIHSAKAVLQGVTKLPEMTDTPLYLAAWSHHIQGRGYQALMNWRAAALHYEASLVVKMKLNDWLPDLLLFVTEVKLGMIEMIQSPIESASRLQRVTEILKTKDILELENTRLYNNLLEDSHIALAEAYLEIGEVKKAATQAKEALELAQNLNDRVGEIRSLYVLYRASARSRKTTRQRILNIVEGKVSFASHPRVAFILAEVQESTKRKRS
jgi:tetratricopeptide (TPR) repeat protein